MVSVHEPCKLQEGMYVLAISCVLRSCVVKETGACAFPHLFKKYAASHVLACACNNMLFVHLSDLLDSNWAQQAP
jgi:hypothetical protein